MDEIPSAKEKTGNQNRKGYKNYNHRNMSHGPPRHVHVAAVAQVAASQN